MGHRNWILIVDSAYPLQSSPGVETIETGSDLLAVLDAVLGAVKSSRHVRPKPFTDSELSYLLEGDAPGVTKYRTALASTLSPYHPMSLGHNQLISNVDEAGKTFHVLILKTRLTIPYTSVFLQLDCKYWSDDQEKRLRERMSAGPAQK